MENKQCLIEAREVLLNLKEEEKNKIPLEVFKAIDDEVNTSNYKFYLEKNKNIEEQISKEALSLVTYIILKYVADKEQKKDIKDELIKNQQEYDRKIAENIKISPMFTKEENTVKQEICVIEEKSRLKKILEKIKKFFKFK